jgi:hypothetical protein
VESPDKELRGEREGEWGRSRERNTIIERDKSKTFYGESVWREKDSND